MRRSAPQRSGAGGRTFPGVPETLFTQSALFQGLALADVPAVLLSAKRVRVERGALLFRQGGRASAAYVLVRGKIKLTQLHPGGQEVIARIVGPGDVFGAIAALADTVYPVSAEAAQASEALAWDGRAMARLFLRYPVVALNALRIIVGRVHELQERLSELVAERIEQRLAQTMLRLVAQVGTKAGAGILLDLPLSRRDLAELTGTTLYTASRILSRWEARGLVATDRQRLLVRDLHGLVSLAEHPGISTGRALDH